MSGGEAVLFWVMAPTMVLGGMGLLFAKKAVHAALCMAVVMVGLGIVYFALDAPFLGSVQIFVYTGAVMMLFLFVLMLVGVDSADSLVETIKGQKLVAWLLAVGVAVLLLSTLWDVRMPPSRGMSEVNADGNIGAIADRIFGAYVFAFEVTGALLITAALGAMVLAHRERLFAKPTQRELSEKRIREGVVKAPLPAPGVFARHNAVDTPALLPDGTPSELSVSRVLTARGQMLSGPDRAAEVTQLVADIEDPLHLDEVLDPTGGDSADGDDDRASDGGPDGRPDGAGKGERR